MAVRHNNPPLRVLPLPMTGLFLLALAALYTVKSASPVLIFFGVAVLATYAVRARITSESAAWLLRLPLYLVAVFAALLGSGATTDGLLDTRWMNLIAYICAAQVVLEAWHARPPRVAFLMLPCVIFLAAANSYDQARVPLFALPFFLCLLGGLPTYRQRRHGRFRFASVLAMVLIGITLSTGYLAVRLVDRYRMELYSFTGNWFTPREEMAGLSGAPVLDQTFDLRGSPRRVLRITGADGILHLRAMAFNVYDYGHWRPSAEERRETELSPEWMAITPGERLLHVSRYDRQDRTIYAPVDMRHVRTEGPIVWCPVEGGPLKEEFLPDGQYDVGLAASWRESIWQGPDPMLRKRLLEVPDEIDPAVHDMAQEIGKDAANAPAKIEAVIAYLVSHHEYSLSTSASAGDPVSYFLLQRKSAHCEYFASAATILLRCLGVPTRYVIGYYAHEATGAGDMVVRQRDAHAWAESWVDGIGWETVEATPGGGRPDGSTEDLPSPLRLAWEWLQDSVGELRTRAAALAPVQLMLWITLLLAPYFLYRVWRARHVRQDGEEVILYAGSDPALLALAGRFDAWLTHAGYSCPDSRPWQEHLAQAGLAGTAADFVRIYTRARFGPACGQEQLTTLTVMLQELERETADDHTQHHGR